MFAERSESFSPAFEDAACALARRAEATEPHQLTHLQEHLQRNAALYLDRIVSWWAIEHGVTCKDAYDCFERAVLEYQHRDLDLGSGEVP